MSQQDIQHRFKFHPATSAEKRMEHDSARKAFMEVAEFFDDILPEGREKAVVITKLEEAMFWANAAIARQNTEPDPRRDS